MITWMQRRKKYLVVTIWISVIAFVGAGFVGWGAYDFNSSRSSAIAKVGNYKIPVPEFQMSYGNHYAYYNSLFGGELTQEKAKELGLEKIVLESMVNEALLLNYAADLGLRVLDDELIENLSNDETFQDEDGSFDKNLYYQVLKNASLDSKTFENHLKKQILIDKLNSAINLDPNSKEKKIVASALLMQDRLAVSVIKVNPNDIKISDKILKDFWEKQKSSYLTPKTYTIKSTLTPPAESSSYDTQALESFFQDTMYNYRHEDGKLKTIDEAKDELEKAYAIELSRKDALQTYLAIKKGEIQAEKTQTLTSESLPVAVEDLENAQIGDVLKPIETDHGYLTLKLVSINAPEPMSFKEARSQVMQNYMDQEIENKLNEKANAQLTLFKGEDIGFVGRDSTVDIKGLEADEVSMFLAHVFDNTDKRGFVTLEGKAVLYEILEQKLLDENKLERYEDMVLENAKQLKRAEVDQALLNALKKRYTVEYYYKGN